MRIKDIYPIHRKIVEAIPGLECHKRFLFKTPIGQILRGIHFDPSAFSKDLFDVSTFVMPLCVPAEHLNLTFGFDVPVPGRSWSLAMPDLLPKLLTRIREDALPYLDKVPTLRDFVLAMRRYDGNPHAQQGAAYALARIGETRQAIAMIEDYLPTFDISYHWEKRMAEEFRAFRHLLIYEPELAAAKLESWETETIRNLGLDRFR